MRCGRPSRASAGCACAAPTTCSSSTSSSTTSTSSAATARAAARARRAPALARCSSPSCRRRASARRPSSSPSRTSRSRSRRCPRRAIRMAGPEPAGVRHAGRRDEPALHAGRGARRDAHLAARAAGRRAPGPRPRAAAPRRLARRGARLGHRQRRRSSGCRARLTAPAPRASRARSRRPAGGSPQRAAGGAGRRRARRARRRRAVGDAGRARRLHQRFPVAARRRRARGRDRGAVARQRARLAPRRGALPSSSDELVAQLPFLPLLLAPHEPSATLDGARAALPPRHVADRAGALAARRRARHARDRTELWHTRLRTDARRQGPDGTAKVRALWSPDYPLDVEQLSSPDTPLPFRMSLHAKDRQRLVKLMAGYDEQQANGRRYRPRSSSARRLHLSVARRAARRRGQVGRPPEGRQPRPVAPPRRARPRRVRPRRLRRLPRVLRPRRRADQGDRAQVRVARRAVGQPHRGAAPAPVHRRAQARHGVRRHRTHASAGATSPSQRVEILTKVTPDLATPGAGTSALRPGVRGHDHAGRRHDRRVLADAADGDARRPRGRPLRDPRDGQQRAHAVLLDAAARSSTRSSTRTSTPEVRRAYNLPRDRAAPDRAAERRHRLLRAVRRGGRQGRPEPADAAHDVRRGRPDELPPRPRELLSRRPTRRPSASGRCRSSSASPDAVADVTYPQVYKDHGFGEADPSKNTGKLFLQLIDAAAQARVRRRSGAKSDALGALAAPQMSILGPVEGHGPGRRDEPPSQPTSRTGEDRAGARQGRRRPVRPDGLLQRRDDPRRRQARRHPRRSSTDLAGADVPKLLSRELSPDRVEASFDWHDDDLEARPAEARHAATPDGASASPLTMHGVVTTPIGAAASATYEATRDARPTSRSTSSGSSSCGSTS